MSTNVGAVDFELLLNSNPFNKGISTAGKTIQSSGIESSLSKIGKLAITAFSVKAIADFGRSCIELGSNLTEVQNVVDVTFGNLNTQVDTFAKNAINQFGLGQTVTKKYVGTFGAMAKAFDFNNQAALEMSETLTGLAGDVSSFYNLSSDESFTKLKSIFTGETESLKDLGVVMTQNALDQYALQNGYGKTTSKMSEQEKVALRYKFVLDKLNLASGDFSRTSDSWANQTRVLTLRFNEFKATIGQGLINMFTPVIKMVNKLLAGLQTLANSFKSFTEMIFGNAGGTSSNLDSIATGADSASGSISSIGDSAAKAQKNLLGLRGIDEINNITTSSADTSGSGASIGSGAENGVISAVASDTSSKSNMFNNINFGPLIESFNRIKEAAQPIINDVKDGLKWLLDNVLLPLAQWTIQDLLPAFLNLVAGALKVLNPLIDAFKPLFQWLWDNFFKPIAEWTGGVIVQTMKDISDKLTDIGNWMTNNQETVNNITTAIVGFFGAWKVVELMSFIQMSGGIVGALTAITAAIWKNIAAKVVDKADTIVLTALYAKDFVVSLASGTAALVKQAAQWVINKALKVADIAATVAMTIATGAATVATWLFNAALAVLTSPITLVVVAIAALIAGIVLLIKNWDKVKEVASNCWNGIKNTFSNIGSWFSSKFQDAYNGVTRVFSSIGSFFSGVWDKVKNTFSNLGSSIGNAIGNAVKTGINGVISLIERTINKAIGMINGAIGVINLIPGVNVSSMPNLNLPRLAQGGYVKANTPQLAMIGDNRHQGEVVAPENKLKEILGSELEKRQGTGNTSEIVSLLKEILKYFRTSSGDIVLNVNDIELARAVIRGMKALQAKTDKSILDFI